MTVVLPEFVPLLGIILGGVLFGAVVYGFMGVLGFCLADRWNAGEVLMMLAAPLGVVATIGAWVWLWSLA